MAKRHGAGAASGNVRFKALRHARGWVSQQQLADAFEEKARECGLRLAVSVRQVRRWESAEPPWPTPDYQKVLQELFGMPLVDLGFTPPWQAGDREPPVTEGHLTATWDDPPVAEWDEPRPAKAPEETYGWSPLPGEGPADPAYLDIPPEDDGPGYGRGAWRPHGARGPVPDPRGYEPSYRPQFDPEHGDGLGRVPALDGLDGAGGRPSVPLPRSIAHLFGDTAGPPADDAPAAGPLRGAAQLIGPRSRPRLSVVDGRSRERRPGDTGDAERLPPPREEENRFGLVVPGRVGAGDLVTGVASWEELARMPEPAWERGPMAVSAGGFAVPAAGRLGRLASPMAEQYAGLTASYRQMYWVAPAPMTYRPVVQHVRLGRQMLEVPGPPRARRKVAASVAETALLAGRIAFFDLGKAEEAISYYQLARWAARIADDPLMDAAVIAHSAFVPAFRMRYPDAKHRIRLAAHVAAEAHAPARMKAWLSAVEAEIEARLKDPGDALRLIDNADLLLRYKDGEPEPAWLDFFDSTRLHGFRGLAELAAERHEEARAALEEALGDLPATAIKQRAVTYADLAQVSADSRDLDEACGLLSRALDALAVQWYQTAYDRVLAVRDSLEPFRNAACVRRLDAELAEWRAIAEVHMRNDRSEP